MWLCGTQWSFSRSSDSKSEVIDDKRAVQMIKPNLAMAVEISFLEIIRLSEIIFALMVSLCQKSWPGSSANQLVTHKTDSIWRKAVALPLSYSPMSASTQKVKGSLNSHPSHPRCTDLGPMEENMTTLHSCAASAWVLFAWVAVAVKKILMSLAGSRWTCWNNNLLNPPMENI